VRSSRLGCPWSVTTGDLLCFPLHNSSAIQVCVRHNLSEIHAIKVKFEQVLSVEGVSVDNVGGDEMAAHGADVDSELGAIVGAKELPIRFDGLASPVDVSVTPEKWHRRLR